MHDRIHIKNHKQEIQLVYYRVIQCLVFVFILIAVLIGRLAYLQIEKHNIYTTLSTKNWLDLVPVEPTRGLIYDRNGILLAENIPVFSLDITPAKVHDIPNTLKALGQIIALSPNDLAFFQKQLKQHRRFDEFPLKIRLTDQELARFTENQHRFEGIVVKARLIRYYPYSKSFSHVLGYVGRINVKELEKIDTANYSASHYIGKLGIEKYYENELHGKVGYQKVESDATGRAVRVLNEIPGTPGKNLYLTLDSGLQFVAERALAGTRGAIVAIQPKTGQVLAIVSQPEYDPNLFVLGISQADYQLLQNSPERPLFDRALRGLYPPGSTIKPYYALQGLATGTVSPTYTIFDPGWFQLPNVSRKFRDWKRYGHGRVDISRAITSSCDTYFYQLGMRMGIKLMGDIISRFGYGSLTGIDLPHELPGVVASPEWKRKNQGARWYDGDTVNSSIGQGLMQVTPLQLASAVATIANRGERLKPTLLFAEQMLNHPLKQLPPTHLANINGIEVGYWDIVINAMEGVMGNPQGTAYRLHSGQALPYTVAGKTGTAQVHAKPRNSDDPENQERLLEKLRDHHLLIAFAPVENPQIALAIVTENSYFTVDAAKLIFDYYLTCPHDKDNAPRTSLSQQDYTGKCDLLKKDLTQYVNSEKNDKSIRNTQD